MNVNAPAQLATTCINGEEVKHSTVMLLYINRVFTVSNTF